jgi:hypothetical protein
MKQSAFFHGTVHGTPARLDTMLRKRRLNAFYAVIVVVRMLGQNVVYLDQKKLSRSRFTAPFASAVVSRFTDF